MKPDMVEDARQDDAGKAPEDRNVLEGAVAQRLRDGKLARGGQSFAVTPPAERGKEGSQAYPLNPDNLRLPIDKVLNGYDREVADAFHAWALETKLALNATVLDWIEGRAMPTGPESIAGAEGTADWSGLPAPESRSQSAWFGRKRGGVRRLTLW